jgi:hypothetical protein
MLRAKRALVCAARPDIDVLELVLNKHVGRRGRGCVDALALVV